MADNISLNSMELLSAVAGANAAAEAINTTLDEWSSQGEKSAALEAFAEKFYELERTMAIYQKLLNKDIKSVQDIASEFFIADHKLAKMWRK